MRTSLLLLTVLLIAAPVRGENPVSEVIATSAGQGSVEPLFTAVLQYQSDSPDKTVVPSQGREGALIGNGDGTVAGTQVRGTVHWSLWSGDCEYPLVRKGQAIPDGLHVCTMNPVGFIETADGARIRFDGRGYGVRSPERYRTSVTLVFGTEDHRYAWLTKTIGLMDGLFDEKAGRAVWNVYIPADSHR
jgi:hypothetical protein